MPPQSLSSWNAEHQQKQDTRERNASETPESDGLDDAIYGCLQPTEETRKRRASETPEGDGLEEIMNALFEESEEPAAEPAEQPATSPAEQVVIPSVEQVATPSAETRTAPRAAKKAKTSAGSKKTANIPAEKPDQESATTPDSPPSGPRRNIRGRQVLVAVSRAKKAAAKPATAVNNTALPTPQSAPAVKTQAQKKWDEAKFETYKIAPDCKFIRVAGTEMVKFSTIKDNPSDFPNITIEGKDERGRITIRRRIVDTATLSAIRKKTSKGKPRSGINDMAESKRERHKSKFPFPPSPSS